MLFGGKMPNFILDWQSQGGEGIEGKDYIVLPPETVDSSSTSLVLVGDGLWNYGEFQQQNFLWLLENFAGQVAPSNPTVGQLWYAVIGSNRQLKIWDGDTWANLIVTGPQGLIGEKGDTGDIIDSTVVGPQGPRGPNGPKGPMGATGPRGPVGPTGNQGAMGPRGAQGDPGEAGLNGPTGPTGPTGADGDIGPPGPVLSGGGTGPGGVRGPTGPRGQAGDLPIVYFNNLYLTSIGQNNEYLSVKMPLLANAVFENVSCVDLTAALTRCGLIDSGTVGGVSTVGDGTPVGSDPVGSAPVGTIGAPGDGTF